MPKESGLRYNAGKLRYDLEHPIAREGLIKVLTKGAEKYDDRNWELGMSWSTVLASLKRHLAAFEMGEDYDPETGLLHVDHIQCNAHFLSAYYKIAPQFDDRRHKLYIPKIGLDIDGVLADFVGHLMNISGNAGHIPKHWNDPIVRKEMEIVKNDESFWSTIPALISKEDIPFEVHCYITARPIDVEITKKWLNKNGFPTAKVYSIGYGQSKVEIAKQSEVDLFVDDSFSNYAELNHAGILTYLYDAPYNQQYSVGYRRIKSLKDLKFN